MIGEAVHEEQRGQYLCERCVVLHRGPGMCPGCEEEPLVDVANEEAMRWVRGRDERRHFRRAAKFAVVGMVLMTPLNLVFAVMTFSVLASFMFEHHIEMSSPWLLAAGFHLSLFGWSVLFVENRLMRRFPVQKAAVIVDGESEQEAPSWREGFERLWSLFISWRTPG